LVVRPRGSFKRQNFFSNKIKLKSYKQKYLDLCLLRHIRSIEKNSEYSDWIAVAHSVKHEAAPVYFFNIFF
jgi:hypothetical protein